MEVDGKPGLPFLKKQCWKYQHFLGCFFQNGGKFDMKVFTKNGIKSYNLYDTNGSDQIAKWFCCGRFDLINQIQREGLNKVSRQKRNYK